MWWSSASRNASFAALAGQLTSSSPIHLRAGLGEAAESCRRVQCLGYCIATHSTVSAARRHATPFFPLDHRSSQPARHCRCIDAGAAHPAADCAQPLPVDLAGQRQGRAVESMAHVLHLPKRRPRTPIPVRHSSLLTHSLPQIGFSILASVSNTSTVYPLLGRAQDALDSSSGDYNISYPTYLGANYDASVTNLSYSIPSPRSLRAPAVELTLSFLSPITPTSTLRQALPASYLTVSAKGDFDIDVYIDLNGQWVSADRGADIVWAFEESEPAESEGGPNLKTFKVKRKHELHFTEHRDRAEWGELHFTGPAEAQHEAGTSGKLRRRWAKKGTLKNEVDKDFRAVMDKEPVFAFSKSFKLSSPHNETNEDSALFTIAHLQDPVTQFASARGLTWMRPLWKSYFHSDSALISWHYKDFANASALAANYSAQVAEDAYASGSDDYKDIVALSARQVMGATSFSGTPDNPIIFLKEISSNGNCQTIDVIFPSFPFFLYTNPRWLAYLLEPLIEHMGSGQYPNKYAMHDLGTHFPNITGHPQGRDEYMPVEECGDILIMGLALVNSLQYDSSTAGSVWSTLGQAKSTSEIDALAEDASPFALPSEPETRDQIFGLDDQWGGISSDHQAKKWLARSYPLWKQWTSYLVEYSLLPENQLCTDDFAGWLKLQTNLALKGIVGIRAMSELASVAGESDDAKYYRNISETYIEKWEEYGMSSDKPGRAKLAYHWTGSWTTLYSLYADALLCFHPDAKSDEATSSSPSAGEQAPLISDRTASKTSNFIPHHIYTTQSRWYSTAMQKYGLPLDSRHLYTKSDWEFQAAAVASKSTRKMILDRVAKWVNETVTDRPFTDLYRTEGEGGFPGPDFFARPVVGSHFAFLALERACGGKGMAAFEWEE